MKIYRRNGRGNISGEKVREARESAGLSQEQLAAKLQLDELNIPQKSISRIETGDRIITDFELIALAKALDVTVYYLLGLQ